MAVIETPPETVAAAVDPARDAPRTPPRGLAAVLGSGDHKVIGRLYIVTALTFGLGALGLGAGLAIEGIQPATLDVFTASTVLRGFTLFRFGSVFLLAMPLTVGVALAVVPLQVGSRAVAFPRAAAASYWGWLIGSGLLIASYAMDGGPGGTSGSGIDLWIAAMGLIVISLLVAAACLATTVIALRHTGLYLHRIPLFAWSVMVASIMWLLTFPVLVGLLVLMYVDHRHGATNFGAPDQIYGQLLWVLRNPQIYVIAIPVLGFAADALATTARARIVARSAILTSVSAFGVLSFGAFLAGADREQYQSWVVIAMALLAVLPVLTILVLALDLFRRGSLRLTAGALYAVASLLALLLGVMAGALGAFPRFPTSGTMYELGITHAVVLASFIGSLGAIQWWSSKIGRQPAREGLAFVASALLLIGTAVIVIADLVSGWFGKGAELVPDWTGGIRGANVTAVAGTALVGLGLLLALVALLPLLRKSDADNPADPWEGQSLEWLAPSPPPLANFPTDLPVVTSAEPLFDLREEN